MRANTLTVKLDDPRAPGGHVERNFINVTYRRIWNGVLITPDGGETEFFDNEDVVDFDAFTVHQAA